MEPDAPDKRAGRIARMRAAEAFGLHYDKTTTITAGRLATGEGGARPVVR